MRLTKDQKLQRNIDRLAGLFGVGTIRANIGSCGRMTNGLYHHAAEYLCCLRGQREPRRQAVPAHITIDHSLSFQKSLETQAHEFAHYLDDICGNRTPDGKMPEPPVYLPEVRVAVGGEKFRHRTLEWWDEAEDASLLKSWW